MQNIYDNDKFNKEYDRMRFEDKGYNANDLIEIPNFRKLVPSVKGKRVLELGCGYGENAKYYHDMGASYVLGIDISKHMIKIAKDKNRADKIEYMVMAMEELEKIDKKFDIVISSLAFHYVEDFKKLLMNIYNLLNDKGYLIFSQEHPLTTCTIKANSLKHNYLTIDDKWYYLISDYNRCGKRCREWNDEVVIKYHRNFSEIINTIIDTGFKIDEILEPTATKEAIDRIPKYIYQYDRPYFLFIKVHK